MNLKSNLLRDHSLWLESFVLVNLAFLSLDIYIAHSFNSFRKWVEYAPFYFSLVSPVVLVLGLLCKHRWAWQEIWNDVGFLVGALAILIGLAGVIFHLDSQFFHQQTLKTLVYSAPFAAPLAYTGLGFLLLINRMVRPESREWPCWVILMSLGGFIGNFIFSLTDHAQNGFFHWTEWIPVISSAFAVGFLFSIFLSRISISYLYLCGLVLVLQAAVGLLGFYLHVSADVHGPPVQWRDRLINGPPVLAPLLFPNLVLLSGIGLWVLHSHLLVEKKTSSPSLDSESVTT